MKIINLTPHAIFDAQGNAWFSPSGTVARVVATRQCVACDNNNPQIKFYSTSYGETENLPPYDAGKTLIVSAMVRMANPDRWDLVSPGELVRNEHGEVVGCKGFDTNIQFI